jgi:hypothetical protein
MAFVAYYQQMVFFFFGLASAVSASLIQQQPLKRELFSYSFFFFFFFFSKLFPYFASGFVFLAFGVWSHTTGILIIFFAFAWRSQGHMENRLSFILRSGFGS